MVDVQSDWKFWEILILVQQPNDCNTVQVSLLVTDDAIIASRDF